MGVDLCDIDSSPDEMPYIIYTPTAGDLFVEGRSMAKREGVQAMIQNEIRLPWEAYEDETISEGTYCIEDSKGEFVAAFILEEHRDFMVRAANNFEELLAAAKEAHDVLGHYICEGVTLELVGRLRDAIEATEAE